MSARAIRAAPELPSGLDQAFAAVAGELGQVTASRLFVHAVARCSGDDGVTALADRVGPTFPVLDAVARGWVEGTREAAVDVDTVLDAVGKATRVVIVGMESNLVDAFVARVDRSVKLAMVCHSPFTVDWDRVLDNYGGRIERVDLDTFQQWAGAKSALLTFAYGRNGSRTAVAPLWLRACGSDVRAQFRALIAWDALGAPLRLYPRWIVEIDVDSFTHFLP